MADDFDEEDYQRALLFSSFAGKASALEDFAGWLRQEAGKMFARGNDVEAHHYRAIALIAAAKAGDERKRQKEYEPLSLAERVMKKEREKEKREL